MLSRYLIAIKYSNYSFVDKYYQYLSSKQEADNFAHQVSDHFHKAIGGEREIKITQVNSEGEPA